MRRLSIAVLAAASTVAFAQIAAAADLPVKAPVAAPAAIPYTWTGFYIGATVGGAWSSNTGTWNPLPSAALFNANTISGDNKWSAFIFGGHVGYNWQLAPAWVAGIEGDFSGASGSSGSFTQTWTFFGTATPVVGSFTTMSSKLDWLASLRGRLGYLVMPNLLAYATGGVAWARFDYAANNFNSATYRTSTAFSQTQTGFAVGGGLEWAWTRNWLLRAEYLYHQFNNGPSVVATSPTAPTFPSGYVWSRTQVSVARLGLSYKF